MASVWTLLIWIFFWIFFLPKFAQQSKWMFVVRKDNRKDLNCFSSFICTACKEKKSFVVPSWLFCFLAANLKVLRKKIRCKMFLKIHKKVPENSQLKFEQDSWNLNETCLGKSGEGQFKYLILSWPWSPGIFHNSETRSWCVGWWFSSTDGESQSLRLWKQT